MPEMPNSSQCMGCGHSIKDQYIYRVQPDMQWHESCLKCYECQTRLEENSTCFIRNSKAYCKQDYTRLFVAKCHKCSLCLKRNDLVMKSKSKVYHLDCFCCNLCSKKLMPGEEYYQAKDGVLYCKDDSASILYSSYSSMMSFNQQYISSTMSVTPESSVTSSSFSPCTGSSSSSSSSSSIVDSPNYNHMGYQHIQQQLLLRADKYAENDSYQDKEEDNSVSDEESNLNDDLDDDQDVSLSDDDELDSFNDSSKKNKKNKHHTLTNNKKLKNNHYNSTSSPNYLQNCFNSSGGGSSKPARIRTVLNEKQLHTLRACYGANPRPDALMKEQLVEMTGLNPRVIRVWFQNKRCKDKKKNMLVRPDSAHHSSQFSSNGMQLPTHPMFDSCF